MSITKKVVCSLFTLLLLGLLILVGCRQKESGTSSSGASAVPTCPIDGLPSTNAKNLRRPLAVMVENSPKARPQSGLTQACVVYEAITEGGITRFLAVYLHHDPEIIGPVRSARPHFINLAREYNAAYVHCGESYEALQILATDITIFDLDQMTYPQPFWRGHLRRAPHNLYTSSAKLRQQLRELKWEGPVSQLPSFTGTQRLTAGLAARKIAIRFPGATSYRLRLEYSVKHGGYLRYMDGKLHVDRETGKPIVAKNVLIQRVYSAPFEKSKKGTYDVEVVGRGVGLFLSNGQQTDMLWQKEHVGAITRFTDNRERPLPFQPGQTWVEIVPTDGAVEIDAPSRT